jgi:hypothetical protein
MKQPINLDGRVKVLKRDNPHQYLSNRWQYVELIKALEGCTAKEVIDTTLLLARSNGWSDQVPSRPLHRMVELGYVEVQ